MPYCLRKINALPKRLNWCTSVTIFAPQPVRTSWPFKQRPQFCRETLRNLSINCKASVLFHFCATFCTKSSVMTESYPLDSSSWTLWPSYLKALAHLCTIPSLIMFSPHTSLIWRWISADITVIKTANHSTNFTVSISNPYKQKQ